MKKFFLLFISVMLLQLTQGQERSSINSANDGDWGAADSWNPAQVPGIGDDVVITHEITVSSTEMANSVMVNSGGMLKVISDTLNVGDDIDDALVVNGGTLYFGDDVVVNVAGYYKQMFVDASNRGTMTSFDGSGSAIFNVSTVGARNSETEHNYFIEDSCAIQIASVNQSFILTTTIENGNIGSKEEVYIGTPSQQVSNFVGKNFFFMKNGDASVTDFYLFMNSSMVGKFTCDIDAGNKLHVLQTTEMKVAQLLLVKLVVQSGEFIVEAGTGLKISQNLKVKNNGALTINSDADGTSGVLIYTPVGNDSDPAAQVNRYLTGNKWHFVTASTSGVLSGDLDQDGSPSVWITEFDESDMADHWKYLTETNIPLNQGQGYSVYSEDISRSDDFTFTSEGNLFSSSLTSNLDYSGPTDNDASYGFNLLGNPYSSAYSFKNYSLSLTNNMHNTFWIWDADHNNGDGTFGRYVYYSWSTGGNHAGTIPIGQGFMVQATSNDNPYLIFDPSDRVYGESNNWMKSGTNDANNSNYGIGTYVMIQVTNGVSKDEVFVSFGENGSKDYENGYDALKLIGNQSAPQLYLKEEGKKLSIDFLQSLNEENEQVVSMSFDAAISGEYTFNANLDSLPDVTVTLEDLKANMTHDFIDGPYSFSSEKDENPDRFLLHFGYGPTGVEDDKLNSLSNLSIYSFNHSVYIKNTSKENDLNNSSVLMYDMLGREIYNNKMNLSNLTSIPVSLRNSYLIVKVINEGEITTTKVFIK